MRRQGEKRNAKSKNKFLKVFSTVIFIFLLFASSPHAFFIFAQEMSSQNFRIQGGNFNMTSGNKSSENFKLADVVGQTAAGIFATKGYLVQAGFLNSAASSAFNFTVTPSVVDFGTLVPNTFAERQVIILVSSGESPGYSVTVIENQPLSTSAGAQIPDTSCDVEGGKICSLSQAAKWSSNNIYGFGFRLQGNTVPRDFFQEDFFRPFGQIIKNDNPVLIMQSHSPKVTHQAIMTLRVNVDQNQPVGQYRNTINFTAIAGI